jgi:hypothetical protein
MGRLEDLPMDDGYHAGWYHFVNETIIFYETADGKCPVQDFLDLFLGKVAQEIVGVLKLLDDLDVVLSSYFKKLIGFLWLFC